MTAREAERDVFVSYKSEDRARIELLVRALEESGLTIWWDAHLTGGGEWRAEIERRLAAARLVLVVWSRLSVGPEGSFVRDEAERGRKSGRLVQACLDRVSPPLGFGEIQALDLVGWRGNAQDPRFADLQATISARLKAEPAPQLSWPAVRARRRKLGFAAIGFAFMIAFSADVAQLQTAICRVPGIRSACGALGLGGVPSEAERRAFEAAIAVEDDTGLRGFIDRYPDGALAGEARARLAACRVVREEKWVSKTRRHPYESIASVDRDASRALAEARAKADSQRDAESSVCYAGDGSRLVRAEVEVETWRCSESGGWLCRFSGWAICVVEERQVLEKVSCR